jgi:CDP-diglyceride synthetase
VPVALAALAAIMALEFYQMMSAAGIPSFDRYGAAGCVALVLRHLVRRPARGPRRHVGFRGDLPGHHRHFPAPIPAEAQSASAADHRRHALRPLYIGLLWNFLTKLLLFGRPDGFEGIWMPGRWLLLYAVFAAKFTDIGAYAVGCAIGRHKLIPRISPAKSWEGVFGGMVLGAGLGTLYVWALRDTFAPLGPHPPARHPPRPVPLRLRGRRRPHRIALQARRQRQGLRRRHPRHGRHPRRPRQHPLHRPGGVLVPQAGRLRNRIQESESRMKIRPIRRICPMFL